MSPRVFAHEPIGFNRMPPAVRGLVIANIVVFLLSYVVGGKFFDLFGLVPEHVLQDRWIWQPLTYLFIHGNIMHLLFNLFGLWMFGMPVEGQWGQWDFLKYYFLCGLGGAIAQVALLPHSSMAVIGASGAIFGLLTAYAMLFPDAVVLFWFVIPLKASHFAILYGLMELFAGTSGSTPGIARFAHLGGMVTGYLYIRWWWIAKIQAKGLWARIAGQPQAPRVSRRPTAVRARAQDAEPESSMAEIDRILDKILVSGLDSLTEEERAIMRRYSDRMKH
ncbi:MAG: rhomboid family intramembrane serine protease [Elusimicrobia bacterium]|nr:rhomboid family intramembrane serine protease [Elusimicrobiota bacterium]